MRRILSPQILKTAMVEDHYYSGSKMSLIWSLGVEVRRWNHGTAHHLHPLISSATRLNSATCFLNQIDVIPFVIKASSGCFPCENHQAPFPGHVCRQLSLGFLSTSRWTVIPKLASPHSMLVQLLANHLSLQQIDSIVSMCTRILTCRKPRKNDYFGRQEERKETRLLTSV